MTVLYYETSNELYHHGVKGMKWGRRRYQNEDGSLKPAGRGRYSAQLKATGHKLMAKNYELNERTYSKMSGKSAKTMASMNKAEKNSSLKKAEQYQKQADQLKAEVNTPEAKAERRKKALKVGAAVAGTALAAYGGKKLHDYVRDENHKLHMKKASEKVDGYLKQRDIVDRALRLDPNYAKRFEVRWAEDKHYVKDAFRNAELDAATDSIGKAARNVIDDRRKRRK